jgi:hypothetical protein
MTAADDRVRVLLGRSSALKRELADFARQPRFEEYLGPLLLQAAGPAGPAGLTEAQLVNAVDAFIMLHRFKDGSSVIDRFLQSRRDLDASDRELLLRWKDPVDGVFEIARASGGATLLVNLLDELKYPAYASLSQNIAELGPDIAFVAGRLVPLDDESWVISGIVQAFTSQMGQEIARSVMQLAAQYPWLMFRNPEKVKLGWEHMRQDRGTFIEFFGADEVVLAPQDVQGQMKAYQQWRREKTPAADPALGDLPDTEVSFELPDPFFEHDTAGLVYDETDGLMFLPGYGTLRELFEHPELAADGWYADALRGYLESDSIKPAPLRRLAARYSANADTVFAKVLGKPSFTWTAKGDALLRKHKPWYFRREPLPPIAMISDRVRAIMLEAS